MRRIIMRQLIWVIQQTVFQKISLNNLQFSLNFWTHDHFVSSGSVTHITIWQGQPNKIKSMFVK